MRRLRVRTRRAYSQAPIPAISPSVKCPGCDTLLPAEDLRTQGEHLQANHPEIIEQRMLDAGFRRGRNGDWIDDRVDDTDYEPPNE